jgi:hypothetical protein
MPVEMKKIVDDALDQYRTRGVWTVATTGAIGVGAILTTAPELNLRNILGAAATVLTVEGIRAYFRRPIQHRLLNVAEGIRKYGLEKDSVRSAVASTDTGQPYLFAHANLHETHPLCILTHKGDLKFVPRSKTQETLRKLQKIALVRYLIPFRRRHDWTADPSREQS